MEDTVRAFLVDIINNIHPLVQIGPNRYDIRIRHHIPKDGLLYIGDQRNVRCEQVGQKLLIHISHPSFSWHVDLADPNSREIIANIFRTN